MMWLLSAFVGLSMFRPVLEIMTCSIHWREQCKFVVLIHQNIRFKLQCFVARVLWDYESVLNASFKAATLSCLNHCPCVFCMFAHIWKHIWMFFGGSDLLTFANAACSSVSQTNLLQSIKHLGICVHSELFVHTKYIMYICVFKIPWTTCSTLSLLRGQITVQCITFLVAL